MRKKTFPTQQFFPALLITLGLAATWSVPALINEAVPTATEDPSSTLEVESPTATVKFTPPKGWRVEHQTAASDITMVHSDGSTIDVEVVSNVKDFDNSARRKAAELDRAGVALAYDGEPIETAQGLKGRSCIVFRAADQHGGECGFVEKDGEMVLVYNLAADPDNAPDIEPLIDSISIQKEA
ncbi:hypothetical protein [Corynebacterium pseudopelargi]|uniref:Uncharacterized protein n=1 Tax=Corynebacterium pseudopelargi TaxID=2080757 RepID=A0A3G6IS44_9CORY|nr:hypothetical protein [Corynebacterium pseudopelargi]AZA08429.1 hypothetical protein CPPEL_01410 [Corynebacterium pseudopelargi]